MGRTPSRAGLDQPSKQKVLGTCGESSTSIPMVETGQEPAAAREAPNASTREMDDADGGREVSQRDTDGEETPTVSNPSAMVRLEKHDTEAARQIRLPERFRQDMPVSGLGALLVSGDEVELRDIVVMATKKMRTVPVLSWE